MHRNSQKYNKLDTSRYSKGIKNSLYSLVSIIIGLLFTYLAMTKPESPTNKNTKNKIKAEEVEDYSFISVNPTLDKPKEAPFQEKKKIK